MKKKIYSLYITKFILSFFVIALHTFYLFDNPIANITILLKIFHVAVPFFFITSGYLLFVKIRLPLDQDGKKRIKKYLLHILFLYLLWFIIYIPLAIYGAYISNDNLIEFIIYTTRKFLFVGESYYSWNLWYLHGLIIAVLLCVILLKLKIKPKYIVCIGVIIFIFGRILDYSLSLDNSTFPIIIQKFINLYLWLFERVRNGFFIGFVYVAIGLLLSKMKTKLKDGIIPFIIGFISYYFNIEIGLILFATGAFIIVINLNIKEFKCYKFLNTSSLLIYLFHMLYIFVYIVIIKQNNNYNPVILFLFTSVCCFCSATIIYFLSKKFNFIKYLYGEK